MAMPIQLAEIRPRESFVCEAMPVQARLTPKFNISTSTADAQTVDPTLTATPSPQASAVENSVPRPISSNRNSGS